MICEQHKCTQEAVFIVFWPGQTTRQCASHTLQAQELANHMGFRLSVVPIDYTRHAHLK